MNQTRNTARDQPLVVSHPGEDGQTLRQRFQRWGYLYFAKAIAPEPCAHLLDLFLRELAPHVIADDVGNPILVGEPFFETDTTWDVVYPRMQSLAAFHGFFHSDAALNLMRTVSGSEVFVYPMKMARISTPRNTGHETPPHQDAWSHHAGPTMAGMWVALHDVAEDMGRLKLLPGSHKRGVRPVFEAQGVGGVQCEIYPDETQWHVSNVERGDVIIFHSCMVHKAEPNTASRASRISIDTRFCDYGAPVFVTNTEPHHAWRIESLSWESIYANWENTGLQYYWRNYPGLFEQYGGKKGT